MEKNYAEYPAKKKRSENKGEKKWKKPKEEN